MRVRFTAFCFCLAWAGIFALYGEESAPGQSKPTETKAGVLSEKPGNAGEGVVAVLTARAAPRVHGKNETPKEGGTEAQAASEEKINLIAEGALATQLADLARRNSTVEVTGILDGASMKVKQVIETAEGTTAPKRKKK